MRKLAVPIVAVLVALGLTAPAAGNPTVRREEFAYADWLVRTEVKNQFEWYGAYVHRDEFVGGGRYFSFASFIRGTCIRTRTRDMIKTKCESDEFIPANPHKDFEMSPLATEGELRRRYRGKTHVVTWTATNPGGPYLSQEWCYVSESEEDEGYGGGISNPAEAVGDMFGTRLNGGARYSGLNSGVMVSTCSFRTVDYEPERNELQVTIRTPR